uniref:deoxyribose-phosphate aldolase n=1 Tax=Poecilia reticulata TaxID=8081 RepID=A0A3P9PWX3_POERE
MCRYFNKDFFLKTNEKVAYCHLALPRGDNSSHVIGHVLLQKKEQLSCQQPGGSVPAEQVGLGLEERPLLLGPLTHLSVKMSARNPGTDLDLEWLSKVRVNTQAVLNRALHIQGLKLPKKQWQTAWLLKAASCIDLTTLAGDDTPSNVHRLCVKAIQPIRYDLLRRMDMHDKGLTTAAVCVYPSRVADAVRSLKASNSSLPVASVATGFPAGQTPLETRLQEVRMAVRDGATEIDIVINRTLALTGQWEVMYREIVQFREACGDAHMKTILATGDLGTLTNIYKASMVAMMAEKMTWTRSTLYPRQPARKTKTQKQKELTLLNMEKEQQLIPKAHQASAAKVSLYLVENFTPCSGATTHYSGGCENIDLNMFLICTVESVLALSQKLTSTVFLNSNLV